MTTLEASAAAAAAAGQEPVYRLWPRQQEVWRVIQEESAEQILYGGAAGGGKSHMLRAIAYTLAMAWPGARIAVFREHSTQLEKTHIPKWRLEMRRAGYDIDDTKFWRTADRETRFANGSIVEFLHIDQSIGAEKWLSAEWAAILYDEATQTSAGNHRIIYSRVRATDEQKREWAKSGLPWRPLAIYATNPGGQSHSYFYQEFVQPSEQSPDHVWSALLRDENSNPIYGSDGTPLSVRRCFVQSFLRDNHSLDERQYSVGLQLIGGARARQLLQGDWHHFEGKAFPMLDPGIHLVDARAAFGGMPVPPEHWPRIAGLDHGTSSPTAVVWNCRDEDGFLIAYLEYYGRGPVGTHVNNIRNLMQVDGKRDIHIEADPRMWHQNQGIRQGYSVAAVYAFGGEPPMTEAGRRSAMQNGIRLHQSRMERTAGRLALQRLLEPDPDRLFPDWHPLAGEYGAPKLFIAKQCPNLWRELQGIQYVPLGDVDDAGNVEYDEETIKENDHAYDALYRSAPLMELVGVRHTRAVRNIEAAGARRR